jgi:hypothetical protein
LESGQNTWMEEIGNPSCLDEIFRTIEEDIYPERNGQMKEVEESCLDEIRTFEEDVYPDYGEKGLYTGM